MKPTTRSSFIFTLIWTVLFAVVFFPCLTQPFVTTFGDGAAVVDNPAIRTLSLESVGRIFTDVRHTPYHPLTTLFYAVEFHFMRLTPEAYHATHLLLHWINTLLIFVMFKRLGLSTRASSLTTLALDIHPLRAESAIWISRLDNLLSTFFMVIAILAYLGWKSRQGARRITLAFGGFLLACLADPASAIAFPFVILLLDKQSAATKKTALPAAAAGCVSLLWASLLIGTGAWDVSRFVPEDLVLAGYALARHAQMLFVPVALSTFQPRPEMNPVILGCCVATAAAAIWAFAFRKKDPDLAFGVGFFIALLAPKVFLLILSGADSPFSDYDSYFASAGLFFWAGKKLQSRLAAPGARKMLFAVFYTVWILWISYVAATRTHAWQSDVAVWTDVLKTHPSSRAALVGRGRSYMLARQFKEASVDLGKALEMDPSDTRVRFYLGESLLRSGDADGAEAQFRAELERHPKSAEALSWLGNVALSREDRAQARSFYDQALAVDPEDWRAHSGIGGLLLREKRFEEALTHLERSSSQNPSHALTHLRRMVAYTLLKKKEDAAKAFREALKWEADGETVKALMMAEFKAAG